MGHAIDTLVFPKETSKELIREHANAWANDNCDPWESGFNGLPYEIQWHEDRVYGDLQEAREAIDRLDTRSYSQIAVLFYYFDRNEIENAVRGSKVRLQELRGQAARSCVCQRKAKMVSCLCCGSRLNRSFLTWDRCPVCGGDLRTDAEKRRQDKMQAKVVEGEKKLRKEIEQVEKRMRKEGKGKVCWAVKVEVHC